MFKRPITPTRFQTSLRAIRESRAMSASLLAEHSGVTEETIDQIESQRYEPSVVLALRIARAVEMPVEAIFEFHDTGKIVVKEERLESQFNARIVRLFYVVTFFSLGAAFILLNFTHYEEAGATAAIMWGVCGLGALALMGSVKGYEQFQQLQQRRSRPTVRARLVSTLAGVLLYGALTWFLPGKDEGSAGHRLYSVLFSAVLYGVIMYFFTYGVSFRKAQRK